MVKKYFRKNILAACLVLSMTASSVCPVIAAEDQENVPESQAAVTEITPESETTAEILPETQAESETEPVSQVQNEDKTNASESEQKISFSYGGIHMEGPEQLKEGDTVKFSLKGMKGENIKKVTVEIQTPESLALSVGDMQADGASMETRQENGKTFLVITSEKGLFSQNADLDMIATVGSGMKDSEIVFSFQAFDMNDTSVFEDAKSFALTAQKEMSNSAAVLNYDKETYKRNEPIKATMDQLTYENYSGAEIIYELPKGAEFNSMQAPEVDGAVVSLMYQDGNGNWNDYSAAVPEIKAVKAVFTPNENVTSVKQTSPFYVNMTAKSTVNTSTKAVSVFKNGEKTETKETAANLIINADILKVSMGQAPEVPSKNEQVVQHVKIGYMEDTDSTITYIPDKALTLDSVSVAGGSYLDGAKLTIVDAEGEKDLVLTGTVDLSAYKNVSSFTIIPARAAYAGNEAAFDVHFQITDEVLDYTCTVNAEAGKDEDKSKVTASLTSKVAYTNLDKPNVLFESRRVDFGDSFQIGFSGIGMKNHAKAASMKWDMLTPSFMTADSFVVPTFKEKVSIELYAVSGEKEKKLGVYRGGEKVELGERISEVRMVITSEETSITQDQNGYLNMTNNNQKNKKNYFDFRATATTQDGGAELAKSSDIRGVTFEIYKSQTVAPEPTKPPAPVPNPETESGGGTEPPSTEPETQESEQNEEFDKRKEEEKKRKEQAKQDALMREQRLKERQKALLKDRISAIRETALTESYAETGSDEKESWDIQPIKENLIKNLVPQEIQPISEKMISNLIPKKAAPDNKEKDSKESEKKADKKTNKKSDKKDTEKADKKLSKK